MSEPRRLWTPLGTVLFVVLGFAIGAGGSAWSTRDHRAEPWRKIKVEHEGVDGVSTRTRLLFENPKLPLQAVEVTRNPRGRAERAVVSLRKGDELVVNFEEGKPAAIEGTDGAKALFSFKNGKARVAFFDPKGDAAGDKVVTVPVELLDALELGRIAPSSTAGRPGVMFGSLFDSLIGVAHAQDEEPKPEQDPTISVTRDIEIDLDVRMPGAKGKSAGKGQIEASCAPLTCIAATKDVPTPGESTVRITVAGTKKKSELDGPGAGNTIDPFKGEASKERAVANKVLPDVSATVAAVAVTAIACKSLGLDWSICVPKLSKTQAGGAVYSVSAHEVDDGSRVVSKRAEALFYQEQARSALDQVVTLEVCVARDGYARACKKIKGEPLSDDGMGDVSASVDLRRGIGDNLAGSHVLTQRDGSGCKFSPSPKLTGPLRMTFDSKKGVLTAVLKAEGKGTRSNLRCSQGSANMRWTQNYTITVNQTFTKEQLDAGSLQLKLSGTMSGVGSYSFSNCRSPGGISGNCPGGKRESYSYPAELVGELDLATQRGGGKIVITKAPLTTSGTWQVPGAKP